MLDIHLQAYPERYTILRPVENKPGSKHTAEGYGFPHVDVPMTQGVLAAIYQLNRDNWTDLLGMSILADQLQDNDFKDPRFPWLLDALRDPDQVEFIDHRIWNGVFTKIALANLISASEQAKEQYRRAIYHGTS